MRVEFTSSVKTLAAARAGYRCSHPDCGKVTIGPGAGPEDSTCIGVAAHIYAASEQGPRGQGGLSAEELRSVSNAIWLCEDHGRLVDANRGTKYAPSVLLGYRDLHEFRIALELKDLPPLPGWVQSIQVAGGPFSDANRVQLGKTTVFRGPNGSGKTTLCEWIAGTFAAPMLRPWRETGPCFTLSLRLILRDGGRTLSLSSTKEAFEFSIDGTPVPYNPLDFSVVYLRSRSGGGTDFVERIAGMLAIDRETVLGLTPLLAQNPEPVVNSAEINDGRILVALATDGHHLSSGQLSGGEQALLAIEYAIALGRTEASYRPTLLCIDAVIGTMDARATERLVARLASPELKFQTIVVTMDWMARFVGWQSYEFDHGPPFSIAPSYETPG